MRKSCRGDPEVVTSDYFAPRRESDPDLRVHTRDGLRDRNGLELRKQMLNVSAASRPSGTAGAMNPMQQLAHRDHADRPLFVADDFVDHGTRALTGDEQVGIDQDGQGLSGGPTSARIALGRPRSHIRDCPPQGDCPLKRLQPLRAVTGTVPFRGQSL